MTTLTVNLPGRPYDVVIERGLLTRAGGLVHAVAPADRALVAVDAKVIDTHALILLESLRGAGFDPAIIELEARETNKTLDTVTQIHQAMFEAKLDRNSPVIAMGGGIVGDVAGFAAATYMRGVPLVQVPTTLLAMVDAAIGGKTGVNATLPDGGVGKNLIGAFWQPKLVLADPETLATLDPRDLRCGLAECVKHGVIGDPALLDFLDDKAGEILACDQGVLTDLVTRSAPIKIGIIEEDERESGRRALLNLGHTFAHVIEPIAELDLRHGEAVSIGLCAAAHCAVAVGRCDEDFETRLRLLLAKLGLPTEMNAALPWDRFHCAMGYDKKVQDGRLRLVLPAGAGVAEIVEDVPASAIQAAWRAVGAGPGSP